MQQVQVGSIEYEELMLKTKDWRVLYPIYFDKKVSRANGRKVPTKLSVDRPDIEDIHRILAHFRLPSIVEINKRHPRDYFCVGRIRYKLTDDDGNLINPEIKNKWILYRKMGELIPKLKNRGKNLHRTDIVHFKPTPMKMPKQKVKKIKGKRRKGRR